MATPCPQCGHRNRDGALICSHCSARLGAEPTASTAFGALDAGRAAPMSPLDDLRVDSDAAPLHRATHDARDPRGGRERRERGQRSDARTGWIVAALSFFGVLAAAGAYWWSTEQGPTQTPAREAAAPDAPLPAPAPAAAGGTPPAPVPPAPVAQTPPASPAAPPVEPSPAPARSSAPAPTGRVATAAPTAPRAEPEAPRRPAVPERPRRATAGEGAVTSSRPVPPTPDIDTAPWAPAGREATNTSAPNYSDAGPPVVAGPGPRYQSAPPTAADPNAPAMPAVVGGDPGPPRAAGPGPRYDYGSPGARARP